MSPVRWRRSGRIDHDSRFMDDRLLNETEWMKLNINQITVFRNLALCKRFQFEILLILSLLVAVNISH